MATQAQILAAESGVKSAVNRQWTDLYHNLSKPQLWTGLQRTYKPVDDDAEGLPGESTRVQFKVDESIKEVVPALKKAWDMAATKEWGNTLARADLVLDGETIIPDVPVMFLVHLDKQLQDLLTFISKLPVHDASELWHWDENDKVWKTDPVESIKFAKVPVSHTAYAATPEHPAQVQTYFEDKPAGRWTAVKATGAVPAARVQELAERVRNLRAAVKFAQQAANRVEVENMQVSQVVLDYIFQ